MLNKIITRRHQKGFTLIEVIISLVVVSAVITQISIISLNNYKTAKYSERRLQAYLIATDQLEKLKALYIQEGSNWANFTNKFNSDSCLDIDTVDNTKITTTACQSVTIDGISYSHSSNISTSATQAHAVYSVSWKNNQFSQQVENVKVEYIIYNGS